MKIRLERLSLPVAAVILSLSVGSIFILMEGKNPLQAYRNLFVAAFSCRAAGGYCALLTTLQFSVPLLLGGLATTVAFRSRFINLGLGGQMVMGAAGAAFLASHLALPFMLHPASALLAGALLGGMWAFLPAVLKYYLRVNEILSTLILTPIAGQIVSGFYLPRVPETARMAPLFQGTRLSAGWIVALLAAAGVQVLLWHSSAGYEQRMSGQAPAFARFGGISCMRPQVTAAFLSGALAGLAGAVEVLGVHYRFVTSFSAVSEFDGIIVGVVGQFTPLGSLLTSLLLGGLRAGAVNGLQIMSGVQRELGGILIALTLLFVSAQLPGRRRRGGLNRLYQEGLEP